MSKSKRKTISTNGDQPVTQAEFSEAMGLIKQQFDHVDQRFEQIELNMQGLEKRMLDHMHEVEARILHHFDSVAEKIHRDVVDATANRISVLEHKKDEHEERLVVVEQKIGLRS